MNASYLHKNKHKMLSAVRIASQIAIQWFDDNLMQARKKFQFMVHCPWHNDKQVDYTLELWSVTLISVTQAPLLGIPFDNNLKFNAHVMSLCKKASFQLLTLKRLAKSMDAHTKLTGVPVLKQIFRGNSVPPTKRQAQYTRRAYTYHNMPNMHMVLLCYSRQMLRNGTVRSWRAEALPPENRNSTILKSSIRSNYTYCCHIWYFCFPTLREKVEKIQFRGLRYVYNAKEAAFLVRIFHVFLWTCFKLEHWCY